MYSSRITVDLPSAETERRPNPLEWLRSLFGAQLDLRSGREELTVGTLWLVEGLVEAFASAGVRDVISFTVDKQVIYLDREDDSDDLPRVAEAAETSGVLDRKFREMQLVLAHRGDALHTTIDCRVHNGVLLGEAEMTIALTSRPRERPPQGAEARRELDALTRRIADELTGVLTGARVTRQAAAGTGDAPG